MLPTYTTLLPLLFPLLTNAQRGLHTHAPPTTNPTFEEDHDWATQHMALEHHISNFDAGAFFTLHDYNSDSFWDASEIKRTYGLEDESNRDVGLEKRQEVVREVLRLFDEDGDGRITSAEWEGGLEEGRRLPDFGTGRGIHYSYEIEYELNHFEHFHDENTDLDDLTHPEDVEHFRRHDLEDEAEERQARLDGMEIVEENIPAKFRKQG